MLEKLKTSETKPFYLTSEFWLHGVLQLLLWVGALPTQGMPGWGRTVISAVALIGYGLSRGLAKGGSPFEDVTTGLSAVLHDTGAADSPQAGTTDIPLQLPPTDGAGLKNVSAAQPAAADVAAEVDNTGQAAAAVQTGVVGLAKILGDVRHAVTEHPEIVQQLRQEGLL